MMTDHDIERLARQLGERAAADIDPQQTAWAVMARLRREGRRRPWLFRFGLVQMAAAATLVLASGLAIHQLVGSGGNGFTFPVPAEVEELADEELAEVLDSLVWETPVSELMPVTLADLSESELTELLESMEG
jgi:hypothetical protein